MNEQKMLQEIKKEIYEKYQDEINLISKNSKREDWQADISVATDMFIAYVENAQEDTPIFDLIEARNFISELKAKI